MGINVSESQPLPAGEPIEVAFDRLLLPVTVTRQTFVLSDLSRNFLAPTLAYDPVARVVRIVPPAPLVAGQSYHLDIVVAQGQSDPGVRAIDGAPLDPGQHASITFPVVGPATDGGVEAGSDAGADGGTDAGVRPVPPPSIDFCNAVLPIFTTKCTTSSCHGSAVPASGLRLDSPAYVAATAVGRVAEGANTGPRSAPQPPGLLFGEDMPIVNPGAPGDSWLMYKLLLAVPPACSSTPGAAACDAGAPMVNANLHGVPWSALPDDERATLASYVQGREMPFPVDPAAPLGSDPSALTLDELDTVSFWIAEGAPVTPCAP